jgi:hypothetical protein
MTTPTHQEGQLVKAPATEHALKVFDETTGYNIWELGNVLAKSGFYKDTKDPYQAVVKLMYGQQMGFPPMVAITGIHVFDGNVMIGCHLLAGKVKQSGRYDYRVVFHDATRCEIQFFEITGGKREPVGVSGFTIEEAKQAGCMTKSPWQKTPRNMLYARAMGNGVRWFCPDLFTGLNVYTEGDDIPGVTIDAEVIEQPTERPANVLEIVNSTPAPAAIPAAKRTQKRGVTAEQGAALIQRASQLFANNAEYVAFVAEQCNCTVKEIGVDEFCHLISVMDARINAKAPIAAQDDQHGAKPAPVDEYLPELLDEDGNVITDPYAEG